VKDNGTTFLSQPGVASGLGQESYLVSVLLPILSCASLFSNAALLLARVQMYKIELTLHNLSPKKGMEYQTKCI
jgi:hypothetical protein